MRKGLLACVITFFTMSNAMAYCPTYRQFFIFPQPISHETDETTFNNRPQFLAENVFEDTYNYPTADADHPRPKVAVSTTIKSSDGQDWVLVVADIDGHHSPEAAANIAKKLAISTKGIGYAHTVPGLNLNFCGYNVFPPYVAASQTTLQDIKGAYKKFLNK